MAKFREFNPRYLATISPRLLERWRYEAILEATPVDPDPGPKIVEFEPVAGYAGTTMVIIGANFGATREANQVFVGGMPAVVVEAEPNKLLVITDYRSKSGAVEVVTADGHAESVVDFERLPWPKPGDGADAPPFSFMGAGMAAGGGASAGDVPSTGTARILVVICYPTDMVPPNMTTARADVVATFADVTTFYDQASYSQLEVIVDVTTHVALLDDSAHYHRTNGAPGYPNIDGDVLGQLMAECAQGAVDQSYDLDDYVVMVASIYMPGLDVRAWGGWSQSNFAYDDGAGTVINITTTHPLAMIAQRENADWGRAAHEFGHNVVDGGLVLDEDVYASDLVDPSEASAAAFEMMGNHDSHPLFSGFYMQQLGWYDAANITVLNWDRNPYSGQFDIIAHGLSEDSSAGRVHLVEIRITAGLSYYVEVRQRPDPSAATVQVFDENIPLSLGGSPDGGVVVTKVITGELNNNQQTRLITLLHEDNRVLVAGDEIYDPLRDIRVTVIDDNIQARPRVCRVRIEWAQIISDTPGGDFDLNIRPWGPGWETEDIWIDRQPFGTYDFTDPSGNPTGNGDEPRPLEINHFYARVRNDGTADASNVKVTHYAITPPGVGDNGNWAPLSTYTIPTIVAGGVSESHVNWVPLVGEHTCLKVAIHQQLGEVSGANNSAQENVFDFQPPASSVPEPISLTVAVRNPLDEPATLMLSVDNVPFGYHVYFPHRWVELEARGEKKLDLLVVPRMDWERSKGRVDQANIRVHGWVARVYSKKLEITGYPGSWFTPIGGVLARVTPKHRSKVILDDKVEQRKDGAVVVRGHVEPRLRCQALRVDMNCPNGSRYVITDTDDRGDFKAVFRLPDGPKPRATTAALPAKLLRRATAANSATLATEALGLGKLTAATSKAKPHIVDQRRCDPGSSEPPPEPPDETDPERPRRKCSFQAHVFNATKLAPADSNLVYLDL
ncbi:IPT/TIG domain-containing protein [Haliangium sp.]|uniref:IPT/TIG domain-containing protein n=1 Tax=Haliangium sp. TaxID=2663208 RepID=UPI003D1057F5